MSVWRGHCWRITVHWFKRWSTQDGSEYRLVVDLFLRRACRSLFEITVLRWSLSPFGCGTKWTEKTWNHQLFCLTCFTVAAILNNTCVSVKTSNYDTKTQLTQTLESLFVVLSIYAAWWMALWSHSKKDLQYSRFGSLKTNNAEAGINAFSLFKGSGCEPVPSLLMMKAPRTPSAMITHWVWLSIMLQFRISFSLMVRLTFVHSTPIDNRSGCS